MPDKKRKKSSPGRKLSSRKKDGKKKEKNLGSKNKRQEIEVSRDSYDDENLGDEEKESNRWLNFSRITFKGSSNDDDDKVSEEKEGKKDKRNKTKISEKEEREDRRKKTKISEEVVKEEEDGEEKNKKEKEGAKKKKKKEKDEEKTKKENISVRSLSVEDSIGQLESQDKKIVEEKKKKKKKVKGVKTAKKTKRTKKKTKKKLSDELKRKDQLIEKPEAKPGIKQLFPDEMSKNYAENPLNSRSNLGMSILSYRELDEAEVTIGQPSFNPSAIPKWYRQLWLIKETIVAIFTPFILLPILFYSNSKQGRCGYVICLMSIYWIFTAIPLEVTALLPVALFPLLGVEACSLVCNNYLKDGNLLFFGGMVISIAFKQSRLDKRIAFGVLLMAGPKPKWIIFGLMTTACFFSMWLNNTAVACIMLPISEEIVKELDRQRKLLDFQKETHNRRSKLETHVGERNFVEFKKAVIISVPFACNIGGIGTLVGTGPSFVLKDSLERFFQVRILDFKSYLIIGFPVMVVNMLSSWVILVCLFIGFHNKFFYRMFSKEDITRIIKRKYIQLGAMTTGEMIVGVSFILLSVMRILWDAIIYSDKFNFFLHEEERKVSVETDEGNHIVNKAFQVCFITDNSVTLTVCLLFFILPMYSTTSERKRKQSNNRAIINWKIVIEEIPWGILLLLGGGLAIGDAFEKSALHDTVAELLVKFENLSGRVISFLICCAVTLATQVLPNMAIINSLLPVLIPLAAKVCMHPLNLTLPATICSSYAFVLPVGTASNAIAFSYGDVTVFDMIKCGTITMLVSLISTFLITHAIGSAFFEFDEWPPWLEDFPKCLNSTKR